MKRIAIMICALFLAGGILSAQEAENPIEIEETPVFTYKQNQKGDQYIKIGLSVNIPFNPALPQLKIGGSGKLGYMRFINSYIAVGGDATFSYMNTIGDNRLSCFPLMAKAMYQPTLGRFEFPIIFGLGGAFETYSNEMYFGLVIKPELGAFYRFSPSWSVGVTTGLFILPQWCKDSEKNRTGIIMDAGITARYHF